MKLTEINDLESLERGILHSKRLINIVAGAWFSGAAILLFLLSL